MAPLHSSSQFQLRTAPRGSLLPPFLAAIMLFLILLFVSEMGNAKTNCGKGMVVARENIRSAGPAGILSTIDVFGATGVFGNECPSGPVELNYSNMKRR